MKFLVDAQLPPALAYWLREAGHEAAHLEDVGLLHAPDGAIWRVCPAQRFCNPADGIVAPKGQSDASGQRSQTGNMTSRRAPAGTEPVMIPADTEPGISSFQLMHTRPVVVDGQPPKTSDSPA